jgi:adenylate cyclase
MRAGSPDRVERRLAAILAADVVGFSRLIEAAEAGTARVLREHRVAADPLVFLISTRVATAGLPR